GKTLVMVKLIELLHYLMKKKLIPQKDILILAPKDEILNQIKKHIDIYNRNATIRIRLRNLKEWEKVKREGSIFYESEITVFYYRADNITEENKDKQINYKTFYNNGNWYLILDEAHKGEKSTSKRQQYYTILSKNGFLFNFSATFTDDIDIITTVFDFKLDTFLKEGYGKKIYIANSEFKNFKPQKKNRKILNDFTNNEKREIVAQTLILLSLLRKHYNQIKSIRNDLYHAPLLITLANSVHVEDADLKIFYQILADIAQGNFNFKASKKRLYQNLMQNLDYLFGLDKIDDSILQGVQDLTKEDFFENVFNTTQSGNIEVLKIKGNTRELAFKLKNATVPFMLIVASDIVKWEDNVLDGYEFGETVEESLFENINEKVRDNISILLGSRIFAEGWDSNRPNIINFINIGVDEKAKKFVLQAIGRGIRIEPIKNNRRRFDYIDKYDFSPEDTKKIRQFNKLLETLFVFATNKEVVKNILEELEKQASVWVKVKGIKKNEKINEVDLPLLVPEFDYQGLNDKPFKVNKDDFKQLEDFMAKVEDEALLLKENIKVRTLNKLKDKKTNFILEGKKKNYKPEVLLRHIDNFFNKPVRRLKEVKILEKHIMHYQEIRTDLLEHLEKLEKEILQVLNSPNLTEEQIDRLFDEGKISKDEYKKLIKQLSFSDFKVLNQYVDYEIFKEHYYVPILLKENSKHFQHIIKVPSEIEFLKRFKEYLGKPMHKLKEYDWWYFSKIDENLDRIKIPYFDTHKGDYSNFSPDFIFWLKKDNLYYIKFVDPKGIEHIRNPSDKIRGFEEFEKEITKLNKNRAIKVEVALYYFNDEMPSYVEQKYRKYWTNDFDEIFAT
ncbi:DEAD/DEAH box helicase family protein, partial [Desulfonauticus submarinus]